MPIRIVGEAARSRRRNTRRGRKRWREGISGRRGKDELSSARENPTWRKRKSCRESETRRASSERERAGFVGEERENHGAFEKVLSCRYARPLRRYRTPVRCCWPRRGRAAFRRQVANKESKRREKEREKERSPCVAISGFGRSLPSVQLPSVSSTRAPANAKETTRRRPLMSINHRTKRAAVLGVIFPSLVSSCIVAKVSHSVDREKEQARKIKTR